MDSPPGAAAAELYLEEVDLAIRSIHAAIEQETTRIRALRSVQRGVEARIVDKDGSRRFLEMNPDLDDEGLGTAARWELHFDDLPEHDQVTADLDEASERFRAAAFSVGVLCGALLQLAKQAISLAEGQRPKTFRGRHVHDVPVGEIVWESRNQSMHFEEGKWTNRVKRVFAALETAHPGRFDLAPGANLAHRVFDELGWHDVERLRADLWEMTGLAPSADTLSPAGDDH